MKDAVETAQGVSVTLVTDLQNVSGTAIGSVRFELEADSPQPISLGPVDIPDTASVRFAIPLTIDAATFDRWSAGGARLAAVWTDDNGQPQRRVVELMRAPLDGEVQ
jgi:hypothetical protein